MIREANDGRTLMICLRTDHPVGALIVEGSRRANCIRCGAEVWLSPASAKIGDEQICLECFRTAGVLPGDKLQGFTAEQLAEARRTLEGDGRN